MTAKTIKTDAIRERMSERGMNASDVAANLGVSRTIVSEWLKGKKVPRPRMLFELGRLLGLKASDLFMAPSTSEPIIAFRKRGNCKPDQGVALEMGYVLERIVDYLPFNKYQSPPRLINPKNTPEYIENVAGEIRKSMNVAALEIGVEDLIAQCQQLKIVLVPVLWGEKSVKYNALSIYLPDSGTNWVFLNLDVKPMDFKFWILHEMIHALVRGAFADTVEEERFCDELSAAILVPLEFAEILLQKTLAAEKKGTKFEAILSAARSLVVSPISLAKRVDSVAKARGKELPCGEAVFSENTTFNKEFGLVSEKYFDSLPPSADEFIRVSEREFGTPAFAALAAYLKTTGSSEGAVAAALGISPVDAKAMYRALLRE